MQNDDVLNFEACGNVYRPPGNEQGGRANRGNYVFPLRRKIGLFSRLHGAMRHSMKYGNARHLVIATACTIDAAFSMKQLP